MASKTGEPYSNSVDRPTAAAAGTSCLPLTRIYSDVSQAWELASVVDLAVRKASRESRGSGHTRSPSDASTGWSTMYDAGEHFGSRRGTVSSQASAFTDSNTTAKSRTPSAQPLPSTTDSSLPSTQHSTALYGLLRVKLERNSADGQAQQHLGLGIAGGVDKAFPPTVSYLRPGYMAHRCDQLQVGDRLVAVNGRRLSALRHEEVMQLVRSSGPSIHLELEYDLNGPYFRRPSPGSDGIIKQKSTEVILEKDFDSLLGHRAMTSSGCSLFGMTIRGGAYGPDSRKSRPITVTAIRPGGPAHREGRLRVGDRIVSVNGLDVAQSTLPTANNLLRQTLGPRAHLTVEYDCSVLGTLRRARGPLLLEIERVPGVDFGVVLTMRWMRLVAPRRERWVVVERVIQASVADRCGAIHPGDVLKAIDGISLEFTGNLAEVYQLLRSECPLLRLELLPAALANQMLSHAMSAADKQQLQASTTPLNQSIKVASNEGSISARLERPRHFSSAPTTGQICHSETMEVILQRPPEPSQPALRIGPPTMQGLSLGSATSSGAPSFGICLERMPERGMGNGEGHDDYLATAITPTGGGIYISAIERGSSAERCGLLQVGDRVVSINDWFTANGTIEEARHVLRHAGSSVTLLVEIDVIEPILPPLTHHPHGHHSTVTVKLVKPRGNNSIGIVCRSECGGKKGEPLVIADIRTGSVAHRCGALQVGDRICAIDGIPLDTCSVEESMRLLQRSSGTVKLSIIKGGGDDLDSTTVGATTPDGSPSAPQAITYSIEMDRRLQQPLGITISSAGQGSKDPVFISQLTPGGLADRTGALHVGDQLIAINGESLMGEQQKVARAIQMLQQPNGGRVQLKIRRALAPSGATTVANGAGRWPPLHRIGMLDQMGGRVASQLSTIQSAGSVRGSEDGGDRDGSEEEKMGSPMKSVDSAVDSLEESPDAALARQLAAAAKSQLDGRTTPHRPLASNAFTRPTSSSHPTSSAPDVISGGSAGSSEPGGGPSSSAGGGGWDSGMSSGAETVTGGGGGGGPVQGRTSRANCCLCQRLSAHHHSEAAREKEDWMRILEALETVGEEEMLRKLEESIIQMGGSAGSPHLPAGGAYPITSSEQRTPTLGAVRRPFSPTVIAATAPTGHYANTASTDHSNYSTIVKRAPPPPVRSNGATMSGGTGKPLSSFLHASNGPASLGGNNNTLPPPMPSITTSPSHDTYASIPYFSSPSSPAPPTPSRSTGAGHLHQVVFTVRLRKDVASKSYGFSVSDGSSPNGSNSTFVCPPVAGIYVNSVLEGSVADRAAIRPMDRVLQVNGTSMDCLNCDLALPLLAAEELELVLMRDGESPVAGDGGGVEGGVGLGQRQMSSIVQSSV